MRNIGMRILFVIVMATNMCAASSESMDSLVLQDRAGRITERRTQAVTRYRQRLAAAKKESVAFASLLGDTPYPYAVDAKELYEQYSASNTYNLNDVVCIVAECRRLHPEQAHCATEDEKDASYKKMREAILGDDAQKMVADLILSGSPVNYDHEDENEDTKPLLKLVVEKDRSSLVPLLLAAGIDSTYRIKKGLLRRGVKRDVLMHASLANEVQMVQILLAAGAL